MLNGFRILFCKLILILDLQKEFKLYDIFGFPDRSADLDIQLLKTF